MKTKHLLMLVAAVIFLCGCGGQTKEPAFPQISGESVTMPPSVKPTALPTAAQTPAPTPVPVTEAPFQTPASVATEVPEQTPTSIATEAPAQTPASVATEVPAQAPTAVATDAPAHVPDMTPVPTEAPSGEVIDPVNWYPAMLDRSILSTGTNERLEKVIQKIQSGEDVSIMVFGGSITEGAGAENFSYSYGEQFIFSMQEKYPHSAIHYHNSGLGGTPSTLGLMRYERDVTEVIGGNPDLVIVEFAVNDFEEPTNGRAYESLVRTILEKANSPAVILLFSVFQSKWNLQEDYIPIGEHYGLPMVSIKDAIAVGYQAGQLNDATYFADIYHPTNYGHKITADCLVELFTRVAKEDLTQPIAPLPEADVYGTDFQGMQLITSADSADTVVTVGGFTGRDSALQSFARTTLPAFPENWQHTPASTNESLKIELTCKNLLLTYKYSSSPDFGTACVYLDGTPVTELCGYLNGGWNNAETVLILDEEAAAPHVLEIKMKEGQENKYFTVLGVGYTK